MDIIIMHETVATHDAIGNDIEAMYFLLSKDYNCYVYANNRLNSKVEYIDKARLLSLICRNKCIVIYHHSVFWDEGYEILKEVKGQIIFKYHNITPEFFFENYSELHYSQCKKGRKQTEILIKEFPNAIWISDSHYNASELEGVNAEKSFVCPPFNKIEQWSKCSPDEKILKELLESDSINLMFVGRVVPNKGHKMLLDIVRVFCINYKRKIKLRIIGKFDDNLPSYNDLIKRYIEEFGISNVVEFIGEINDSSLVSYYLGSDLLVCTSEHEGFCVPVAEAQFFGLPVLALDQCAVPETLGKKQMLFDNDSSKFAAAIKIIYENQKYQKYLSDQGKINFNQRFSKEIITRKFKDIIFKTVGL